MRAMPAGPGLTVVGLGADGWDSLGDAARTAVTKADVILGAVRHLALIPASAADGERVPWPRPLVAALPALLERYTGREVCVLGSGDPMFFGIGTAVMAAAGRDRRVDVVPHVSSFSLACARLGWAVETTDVVSAVGRDLAAVRRLLQPGRRLVLLSEGSASPAALAGLLVGAGFGDSRLTVLEALDAAGERVLSGMARTWEHPPGQPLNVVGVDVVADPGTPLWPTVPGLPDDAFEHDGALTKWEIRAPTLARLAPVPGQLLLDVGSGSGSVAIEWLRTDPRCRAVAVEARPDRAERIVRNAAALGVPSLRVVVGTAPDALRGIGAPDAVRGIGAPDAVREVGTPDAVFVGGGLTGPGVLDACWDLLGSGGRLVANAVTIETEQVLVAAAARRGGSLVRLSVERAGPVGGFTAWRPALPVVQWSVVKP